MYKKTDLSGKTPFKLNLIGHSRREAGKALCVILFFAAAAAGAAFDWPSQDAAIQSNFGWNNKGRPKLGDTFSAQGPVTAVDEGELVFACTGETSGISRIPSPFGAWIAIDHGDGLVSIYAHIDTFDTDLVPKKIEQGIVIANSGSSGWTEKPGYYLSFYDRKERRWVNPSLIMTPKEDTRAPVIQSVKLKNDSGSIIDIAAARALKQGHYTINIQTTDTRLSSVESPLAPFRIISSINGIETGILTNETFSARDGSLMVYRGGLSLAKQVYAPYPAVELSDVTFTRGQINLAIIVQDITGNTTNAVYRLFVE